MFSILSDKICTCHLNLGASSSFQSKSRQRKECLKYFGYNYLTQTFDSENGKKILDKCDKMTEEKYKDVLNGERKTMITSPPHFIYSSKIKDFSVMDNELEDEKERLEKLVEKELKDEVFTRNSTAHISSYLLHLDF